MNNEQEPMSNEQGPMSNEQGPMSNEQGPMSNEQGPMSNDGQAPLAIQNPKSKIQNPKSPPPPDFLWPQLKTLPAFRAVLRAVEARFYHQVPLPEPLLDLGCGDANFAELTFGGRQLGVGLDPWWNPLRKAQKTAVYGTVVQGMGDTMPFPDGHFASAISNSVLEHIPDIQPVLDEVGRVLQVGGRFVITMPNHRFTERLWGAQTLEKLGLRGLADRYRVAFNFISRHQHTESAEWWCARLAHAGMAVERWQYYFSEKALHALEFGHAQGIPSAVLHALTGQWILVPTETNLALTDRWLRPFYDEEAPEDGTYVVIIARKVANQPIAANLPQARPFTREELALAHSQWATADDAPLPTAEPLPFDVELAPEQSATRDELATSHRPAPPPPSPASFQLGYLLAAVVAAVVGQTGLIGAPQMPSSGLRWYGVAAVCLALLAWSRRTGRAWPGIGRWPSWRTLGQKYGLAGLGLALSWVGFRLGLAERPLLALLAWLLGGAVAFYALWPTAEPWPVRPSRTTWLTALGLLGGAWLIRLVGFTSHPFILSGTEANLGLAALNLEGNPFSTSWLTNPVLSLYALAVPVRLFGRTTLALRLFSPVAGALTVAAVYLLGQKLWNKRVGVAAAVLLLGSHTHLHYSRLGLTNIWDPLVMMLGLGLLAVAWQEQKRGWYLLAGLALGLNAYFFTSLHLLPFVLLGWLGVMWLGRREQMWANGRHILAAVGLALVVALPQILFFNANPALFWDRINSYSLWHTGWLANALGQGQGWSAVLQTQIWPALLAYQATADVSTYYHAEQPLLTFWPALALGMGILVAAWRRGAADQMLLWWLGLTAVLGGALLLESPASHRYLVAIPAACLLAAVALERLVQVLFDVAEQWGEGLAERYRPYQIAAVVLLAITMTTPDVLFYFGPYRAAPGLGDTNTEIAYEVGTLLQTRLDGSEEVYFLGAPVMFADFPTITFLGERFVVGQNLFNLEPLPVDAPTAVLPPASAAAKLRFVLIPSRFGDLATLRQQYPNGRLEEFPGYYANPLFLLYSVDGQE